MTEDVGETPDSTGACEVESDLLHRLPLGGGLAWGIRPGPVGVGGHVVVAAGWAQVRGVPREPGIPSGSNAGLTGEASVGLGPRVRYGRLRFDVDAELGGMLRPPIGLVEGGPPMTMGGLWAGVVLRLGGALRRSPSPPS